MSDTSNIDIEYLSRLARISLSDEEKAKFSSDLNSILGYIEKLSELDTEGVEPTAHPHPVTNVWQEDIVKEGFTPEEAMSNAPASRQNMIIVPKVVE